MARSRRICCRSTGTLLQEYRDKAPVLHGIADNAGGMELEARLRIRLAVLRAGRHCLTTHDDGLDDETLTGPEAEADLEELRMLRLSGTPAAH